MKKIIILLVALITLVGCSSSENGEKSNSSLSNIVEKVMNNDEMIGEDEHSHDPEYKTMFDYTIDDGGMITLVNNKGTYISDVTVYVKKYDNNLNFVEEESSTTQYLNPHMLSDKYYEPGETIYLRTGYYQLIDDYDETKEYNKAEYFYEIDYFTYTKPYDDGTESRRYYIVDYINDFDVSYSIEECNRDGRYDIYVTITNNNDEIEYTLRAYTFYKFFTELGWEEDHNDWNEEDERFILKPNETVTEKVVRNMPLDYGKDTEVKVTLFAEDW